MEGDGARFGGMIGLDAATWDIGYPSSVELADEPNESRSQRSPRRCWRLKVSGAIGKAKAVDPLLHESEPDRVRQIVLEQALSFGENVTLRFGSTKELLEPRRAQHERLTLGGTRGAPRRDGVNNDSDGGNGCAREPKGERVPERERDRDTDQCRHPTGRCPARAEASRAIGKPTSADHFAFELILDEIRDNEKPRFECRELHGRPVREKPCEGLALVLA